MQRVGRLFTWCLVGSWAFALGACSGASGTGLFLPSADSATSDGGDGVGDQDQNQTQEPGEDGAIPRHDGGDPPRDATIDVFGNDGSRGNDASADEFSCGGSISCFTASSLCCATQENGGFQFTTTYDCVNTPNACGSDSGTTTSALITCHSAKDCPGQYCCGNYDGLYHSVTCSPTCPDDSDGGNPTHVTFCSGPDASNECPPGLTCSESTLLTGFYRCWTN